MSRRSLLPILLILFTLGACDSQGDDAPLYPAGQWLGEAVNITPPLRDAETCATLPYNQLELALNIALPSQNPDPVQERGTFTLRIGSTASFCSSESGVINDIQVNDPEVVILMQGDRRFEGTYSQGGRILTGTLTLPERSISNLRMELIAPAR